MNYEEFEKKLIGAFPQVSALQMERFRALEPLYKEWNSKINVISRKDIEELYCHHILHSLSIAAYLHSVKPETYDDFAGAGNASPTVLDLGTGGGFPGIPLSILFPAVRFTLCDSIGKKVRVAEEVAKSLGLENVITVNARAETLDDKFDYIVSRAVTSLENFIPFVKGKYSRSILYLKGGDIAEEIAAMMGKYRMAKGSVRTWRIDSWTNDPYFKEKFVIEIESRSGRCC